MANEKDVQEFRDMAKDYRKMAEITDKVADTLENETLSEEEKDKKTTQLLAEMMVQAMKIR